MHGIMRIFRTAEFSISNFEEFLNLFTGDFQNAHFLMSDGIMLDFRKIFPETMLQRIMVQRILTCYQLQKILMDSDENPHYISVTSLVMESWPSRIIESIHDIMKIKAYYRGTVIFMNVVGNGGVFEKYLGRRILPAGISGRHLPDMKTKAISGTERS